MDATSKAAFDQVRTVLLRELSDIRPVWLGRTLTAEEHKVARKDVLQLALALAALDAQRLGPESAQATGRDLIQALRLSVEATLPQLELEALGGTNSGAQVLARLSNLIWDIRDTVVKGHLGATVCTEVSAMKNQFWNGVSERLRHYALTATSETLRRLSLRFQNRRDPIALIDDSYHCREPDWTLDEQLELYWQLAQGLALDSGAAPPDVSSESTLLTQQRGLWSRLGVNVDEAAIKAIAGVELSSRSLTEQMQAHRKGFSDHQQGLLHALRLSKSE